MATQVEQISSAPVAVSDSELSRKQDRATPAYGSDLLISGLLALVALVVHGYHPYAEDGGLYVSGIKRLLDPALYPYAGEFAQSQLRYSVFAPIVAGLVRASGLRLPVVLFVMHVLSLWATIFVGGLLAWRCCGGRRQAQRGVAGLLALALALPIAGTSLLLMDPYLTARSLSTPCTILAMVGVLRSMCPGNGEKSRSAGWVLCGVALALATAFHPLMGGYACGAAALLACSLIQETALRTRWLSLLALVAVGVAASVVVAAPAESEVYWQAARTRDYWFLARWHWFEWCGALLPLLILSGVLRRRTRKPGSEAEGGLARMAVCLGSIALAFAGLLARPGMRTHLVARLQPLRVFQVVYIVLIIILGSRLGELVLGRKPWRWAVTFAVLGGTMITAARETYPDSPQMELPWGVRAGSGRNGWVRAFEWVRENTPKNAVFALPADYITRTGEDAEGFRAIAERSMLPDQAKDAGSAANAPALAADWVDGVRAQSNLERLTDQELRARLLPRGVSWVLLPATSVTELKCPYRNASVEVCRLW